MQIQHHTKYKEIDGMDEIVVLPSISAHIKEHWRLRKAGKPPVPRTISKRAHDRTPRARELKRKYKNKTRDKYTQRIDFFTTVAPRTQLRESVQYAPMSGNVSVYSWFRMNGQQLYTIDEGEIVITEPSSCSSATGAGT